MEVAQQPQQPMEAAPQPQDEPQDEAMEVASPPNESPTSPSSEDDDVRYEPITEPFLFEGAVIYPCYCILPFISDSEVEASCKRPINVYYGNGNGAEDNHDDEAEEGELQIDESRMEE